MSTPPPISPDQPNPPPVPQQPYHAPVAPTKSKMGGGTKALLFGCLGMVILALIAAGFGGKWAWGKVKGIAENPEQFVAEQLVKAHPELELMSVDKATRTITFKDKASGESMTAMLADFKDGQIILTKSDGSKVELGPGGLKVTDKDGSQAVAGAGESAPLPEWVPAYPGPHTVILSSRQEKDGSLQGVYVFGTEDDVPTAKASWQKTLKEAGFDNQETAGTSGTGFQAATVKSRRDAGSGLTQTITVQISTTEGKTQVNLNYDQSPVEK